MVKLYNDDNRRALKSFSDNSIHSIVTDPPYELGFMGKKWDSTGIAYDVELWKECLRVLKPGGYLLSFGGTRTYHRMTCAIEDAGFEIRDQIQWLYGSGFPKSHNIGNGLGTALKPANEPIVMARKPLIGTVAANVLEHGTGALNIDACRITIDPDIDDKRLGGKGSWASNNMAKNTYGKWEGNETTSSSLGRWPANVIHDGSDEVVELLPDSKGQQGNVKGTEPSRTSKNVYSEYGRIETLKRSDSGSAARFFYCAKTPKSERDAGLEHMQEKAWVQFQTANGASGKASSISEGRSTAYRNDHPTVKPVTLMRYLCRLVTPIGGIVLDPFMGSGSTGIAAVQEDFDFVGIEIDKHYFEIAEARINNSNKSTLTKFIE